MTFKWPWVSRRALNDAIEQHAIELIAVVSQATDERSLHRLQTKNHGIERKALLTEIKQIKRAGLAEFATQLGVTVNQLPDRLAMAVHEAREPRLLIHSFDNAQASEVKFRLVKLVNLELRDVLRSMIRTVNSVADKPVNRVTLNHLKVLQAEVAQAEPWAS